ncbi:MAG: type II toxin-antitoxin system VapC family toxin [Saprospiraceae bacterium]|nr:type II toxin-antitoxin system VapC family toxin [Saprospiraceae bacterium]
MRQYLLDTNICIYYMKGLFDLDKKFASVKIENCFISEITLAELKFGVENSKAPAKNQKALDNFLTGIQILPIFEAIDTYAKEKARLRKSGRTVDDFDLLIGSTSVAFELTLVTNNTKHFENIKNIKLENWSI